MCKVVDFSVCINSEILEFINLFYNPLGIKYNCYLLTIMSRQKNSNAVSERKLKIIQELQPKKIICNWVVIGMDKIILFLVDWRIHGYFVPTNNSLTSTSNISAILIKTSILGCALLLQ